MTLNLPTTFLLLTTTLLLLHPTPSSSDFACKNSCGSLAIHYPFGTGAGCGSPAFQPHVTCDSDPHQTLTLTLTTHTGSYPIQAIDYTNQVLYLTDPSMSTCSSANTSNGFSLDWNAPFTFLDGNIFALLDCSTSSSPLYSSNATDVPLCDTTNAPICTLLYSCPPISLLNAPISTCCIYAPVSLGPSFEMDLKKLQCSSYSGIYSFNGAETDPSGWEFGIALKYRFSVDDGYPSACADCERSNGVCGYTGRYNSFTCSCGNGMNSSTNCYFASASWNGGSRTVPLWIGIGLISSWWLVVAWMML